jgi:putative membrane protein
MWYHNMGWGAWVGMSFAAVVFWALVIWLVVTVVRDNGSNNDDKETESPIRSAERILAERYARGEIDTDAYNTRLKDLRGAHLGGVRS